MQAGAPLVPGALGAPAGQRASHFATIVVTWFGRAITASLNPPSWLADVTGAIWFATRNGVTSGTTYMLPPGAVPGWHVVLPHTAFL